MPTEPKRRFIFTPESFVAAAFIFVFLSLVTILGLMLWAAELREGW